MNKVAYHFELEHFSGSINYHFEEFVVKVKTFLGTQNLEAICLNPNDYVEMTGTEISTFINVMLPEEWLDEIIDYVRTFARVKFGMVIPSVSMNLHETEDYIDSVFKEMDR